MDKKGFLFVVTVFLILTYILLSISVWVKGIEASERAYSEFYKESNVELAIEQITPERLDNVTNVLMDRSLYRLNDQAMSYPLQAKNGVDEDENLRQAMYELFMDGNASGSHFYLAKGVPNEKASFNVWAADLNASLRVIGVYISGFSVSDFRVSQSAIDRVNYSFIVDLNVSDYSTSSSLSRRYYIKNSLDIGGLPDPALVRESYKTTQDDTLKIYRQFFFNNDYPSAAALGIQKVVEPSGITAGQGWVYGYLALASGNAPPALPNGNDIPLSERRLYVLVGKYSEIVNIPQYDAFGGFIVTDQPVLTASICGNGNPGAYKDESNTFNPIKHTGLLCDAAKGDSSSGAYTTKPFIVISGAFDPNDPRFECPLLNNPDQKARCALIKAAKSPIEVGANPLNKLVKTDSAIVSVETMRDFVMCGYYTYDPNAPSYLQHLMNGTYSRNDTKYGIETFVIGQYANSSKYDTRSRLDRELFTTDGSGTKVRGMPGCRDFDSCASDPQLSTGVFAVSDETKAAFGLDLLACPDGSSGLGVCD